MNFRVNVKFNDGLVHPIGIEYREDELDGLAKFILRVNPDVVEMSATSHTGEVKHYLKADYVATSEKTKNRPYA